MMNSHSSDVSTNAYYGPFACGPDSIPPQKNQTEELNRTGLDRSASLRLPWGNRKAILRVRRLVLSHRYSKLDGTVGDILGAHGSATMCYAYWDFIQNYMDLTRPLPEMPMLEKYRPMDPITAEYDQQTGRHPRYWRDMDDQTFKKKVDRMFTDVTIINTAQRPNLLEKKLSYAS